MVQAKKKHLLGVTGHKNYILWSQGFIKNLNIKRLVHAAYPK